MIRSLSYAALGALALSACSSDQTHTTVEKTTTTTAPANTDAVDSNASQKTVTYEKQSW